MLIPTYRPDPLLLRHALVSVLQQDAGRGAMAIEVVDDASPDNRPDDLVREIGGGRVALHRQPKNLGLAGNWNACIERAEGDWVHLLHQDDYIYPGFYDALQAGLQQQDVAIAFSRHAFIDSEGNVIGQSDLEREAAGIVQGFLNRIASGQRIQFSSALLRREACLKSGGFDGSLAFALDWEMWARLASRHAVWFEPQVLACFRIHNKSEGWRLAGSGLAVRDHVRAIARISSYVPLESRRGLRRLALEHVGHYAFDAATRLVDQGDVQAGIRCGWQCLCISRTPANVGAFLRLTRRAVLRVAGRPMSRGRPSVSSHGP